MSKLSLGSANIATNYDPVERRARTVSGITGNNEYYNVYDGSILLDAQVSHTYDMLTVPGSGEVLAFSDTPAGGGSATLSIPIHDAGGATLGMVNSSGSVVTNYTYDPLGSTTTAGLASANPFLFAGMEFNGVETGADLYLSGGNYYSPQLGRPVSPDGPIDASCGGGGSGGGGGQPAGDSNSNNFLENGAVADGAGLAAGAWIASGIAAEAGTKALGAAFWGAFFPVAGGIGPAGWVAIGVTVIAEIILDILDPFGGSSTPTIPRKLQHRPHTIQHDKIGLATDEVVIDMKKVTPVYQAPSHVPFATCAGVFVAFSAPAAVGCVSCAIGCVNGVLPACGLAAGLCLTEAGGIAGCYSQAHGGQFANFGEDLPPGEVMQPMPRPPLENVPQPGFEPPTQ